MTLKSKAKLKTEHLVRHIELLGQNALDGIVEGFEKTDKELIRKFTLETLNLIQHHEWGIGLENLLTNIYEIDFKVDKRTIELAKDAIEECGMDYSEWKFIEELVKI